MDFQCPLCKVILKNGLCPVCKKEYVEDSYFNFTIDKQKYQFTKPDANYINVQEVAGENVYYNFFKPSVLSKNCKTVLDIGCGIGTTVNCLLKDGYDAYGIDLPIMIEQWRYYKRDTEHYLSCDATNLPFPNNSFDLIMSMGVIEHIGTEDGDCTLRNNYKETRQNYANEILRVIKPGGSIIISCPNKSFPIDIQHGPVDRFSKPYKIRKFIHGKTKLNFHKTLGKYHLLSYKEVEKLFIPGKIEPLSLKNYFSYSAFRNNLIMKSVNFYVEKLPKVLRKTFLNPYMLVRIRV